MKTKREKQSAVSCMLASAMILGLGSSLAARAQCTEGCTAIHTLFGEAAGDQFGWKSNNIGDVTADGVNDFVITAPFHDTGGNNAGRAYVYSGADGTELFNMTGTVANGQFGRDANRAGDVNGDLIPDVIVGAPQAGAGRATVHSGVDGSLIHTFLGEVGGDQFGFRVSGGLDVNGDGASDLLVSAATHDTAGNNAGRAYAYSGVDFSLICSIDGVAASDQFGTGLNGVGDVNGDNRDDFVVGARNAGGGPGRAYVVSFDGVSCSFVHTLVPSGLATDFGHLFAGGGHDANADGTPDIYVGDFPANRAHVFSGVDGSTLQVMSGDGNGQFGLGEMIPDVNGDGHADLILAAWVSNAGGSQAGKAFVYSGRDGAVLETFTHNVAGANFGFDAKGLGDVDGDGRDDYLITAATDLSSRGVSYVIAGTVAPVPPPPALLVAGWSSHNVVKYVAQTGDVDGVLIPAGLGGLGSPHSVRLGPDGRLYVTSVATNNVLRFDPEDGSFIDVFVTPGGTPLNVPTDALFGPDGDLYVASFNSGQVLRFDGIDGSFIGVFATGPAPGRVETLAWGPDGHLYVATGASNSVTRYDGATGAALPGPLGAGGTAEFVPAGSGGLNDPHSLIFGPDDNLYVSSMDAPRVVKYDGTTGALLDVLVVDDPVTGEDESGGLSSPHGMRFGPGGDLYVCSFGTHNVLRYDASTGAFVEIFATGGGLVQAIDLLFTEHPGDFDDDFDVDVADADAFGLCFAGSGVVVGAECLAADFNNDKDVDCGDWRNLRRGWTGPPASPSIFAQCDTDCNTNSIADDLEIEAGTSGDCNENAVPDDCDIADGTSLDEDLDGVPDECGLCPPTDAATLPLVATHAAQAKSRSLSVVPGNAGRMTALRVTLTASATVPGAVGSQWWIGEPTRFCENSGQVLPPGGGCGAAPSIPKKTMWASGLVCDPVCLDWQTTMDVGDAVDTDVLYVIHPDIASGSTYEVEAIDCECDPANADNFSAPVAGQTSSWGDTIGGSFTCPGSSPNGGPIDLVLDCIAILNKFSNLECAVLKSRADIDPHNPNGVVDIVDVTECLGAFSGGAYPNPVPVGCP